MKVLVGQYLVERAEFSGHRACELVDSRLARRVRRVMCEVALRRDAAHVHDAPCNSRCTHSLHCQLAQYNAPFIKKWSKRFSWKLYISRFSQYLTSLSIMHKIIQRMFTRFRQTCDTKIIGFTFVLNVLFNSTYKWSLRFKELLHKGKCEIF